MKTSVTILALFIYYLVTSSFQCKKCRANDLLLDEKKNWLPPTGMTQKTFSDENNNLVNFKIHVLDSIEIVTSQECGTSFKIENKFTTLYLNTSMTDSIYFRLSYDGWLRVWALSNGSPNISVGNVFYSLNEGIFAKKLFNYSVGTHNYPELILVVHGPTLPDNIDSVFLVNNIGIVGFKYLSKKYSSQ
jgi:hypothetical protein